MTHHTIPLPSAFSRKFIDRFWDRVDRSGGPDSCWPWLGGLTPAGYGRVSVDKRGVYAHRVALILGTGESIDGLMACHSCDNPRCCNPSHLWAGTMAENMRDRDEKGRGAKTPVAPEIQARIRDLRASGRTIRETATAVGCGKNIVLKYGGPSLGRKPRKVMSPGEAGECVRLRQRGWLYKDIAERLDVSEAAAWMAVNKPRGLR